MSISPNGTNATVLLNGTHSSDPEGDSLQYLWFSTLNSQPSALVGRGDVTAVILAVGTHSLLLVVSDGLLTATNAFTVEVITTLEATQRLIAQVISSWPRSQPLVATLSAALDSFKRGNHVSAMNQLAAFQNKVRAQVAPHDAALAQNFIQQAQEIIEALSSGNTTRVAQPHDGLHLATTPYAETPHRDLTFK